MIHWKEILFWSYLCGVLNDSCILIYFYRFGEVLAIITVKKKSMYNPLPFVSDPGALASAH